MVAHLYVMAKIETLYNYQWKKGGLAVLPQKFLDKMDKKVTNLC